METILARGENPYLLFAQIDNHLQNIYNDSPGFLQCPEWFGSLNTKLKWTMLVSEGKSSQHSKDIMILLILSVVGFAIALIFNIFLARHLSKELYGDFSLALKTFTLGSSMLLIGTGTAAKNYLSRYLTEGSFDKANRYILWNFTLVLSVCKIFLIFTIAAVVILSIGHFMALKQLLSYHLLVYILPFGPLYAYFWLSIDYLQSSNNIYWANFLGGAFTNLVVFCLLSFSIYFIELTFNQLNLSYLIVASIAIVVIMVFFLFSITVKNISLMTILLKRDQTTNINPKWRITSNRLIANHMIYLISVTLDLALVEIFAPDEDAVGEYSAILSVTSIITVLAGAICSFITPLVSTYIIKDPKRLQQDVNSALIALFLVNVSVVGISILFAAPILSLFNPSYYNDTTAFVLMILVGSSCLLSFCEPSDLLISFSGNSKKALQVTVIAISAFVVSGVVLTIYFSIIGTAFSFLIYCLILLIGFVRIVRNHLHYKPLGIV